MRLGWMLLSSCLALTGPAFPAPAPPPPGSLADMDLSAPFATRSPWRLTAIQQAPLDPADSPDGDPDEPGPVALCLHKGPAGPCDDALRTTLNRGAATPFDAPHFLETAQVVPQPGKHKMLLVRTSSTHGGNGDQLVLTQLLAYRAASDRFERVFAQTTRRNNNQEIRYVPTGKLAGDIISAEPTGDAPFGFWVVVNRMGPAGLFRPILRFRSATRYNDGNSLPVIDSEMPTIQKRLGYLRPGMRPPLPPGPCPKPHMIGAELWCE